MDSRSWDAGTGSSSSHVKHSKRAPPSSSFGSWERGRKFGIVIDAGSSGSRLQVYSWLDHAVAKQDRLARGDSIAVLPRIEKGVETGEDWTLKVEPGISSLASDPDGVDSYLKPLFDHARSIIPPSQLSSTPVYLLATAGMRLLTEDQSTAILSKACRYIQKSTPFRVDNCDNQIRIISGEEEGIYGWVAINYLMDGFDAHGLADKGKGRHSSTYGFLDMGGASTQIAFEPSTEARKEHADNLLSVNLRLLDGMDVHHPVFVTTWLGYGTNQARERYVDATISHYLKEHPPDPELADKIGSEKPMTVIADPCLPKDLLLTESRHQGYALLGKGDFPRCLDTSLPLLNRELPCPDSPCLMGVHVPPIDFKVNHFIGISEYWYSTHDIWSLGGVYDFPTFERSALEYCSQDWESIMSDHSEGGSRWKPGQKVPDVHRLEMQCFKAAWIVNVLHEGIGIPRLAVDVGGEGGHSNGTEEALRKAGEKGFAHAPSAFQSVNEINNVAVSWTLGRMVLEVTNTIAKSSSSPAHGLDDDAGTPVFEWKSGHAQSRWRQTLGRAADRATRMATPINLLGIVCMLFLFYYFYYTRKRRRPLNRLVSARGEYTLESLEEGDDGAASPRKTSSAVARSLMPLRHMLSRASSFVQSPNPSFLPVARNNRTVSTEAIPSRRPLRHASSSPTLQRGIPIQRASTLPHAASFSKLNLDLSPAALQNGSSAPLTPPARSVTPAWPMRTNTSPNGKVPSRSDSPRPLHQSTVSSDSEGFLYVPVGVSSTAPQITATSWDNTDSGNDGLSAFAADEGKPGLRSRTSSHTNLRGLARNRGGKALKPLSGTLTT